MTEENQVTGKDEKENSLADEIMDKLEDAFENGDGFFITIHKINGNKLSHYQVNHMISIDDRILCLDEAFALVSKEAPKKKLRKSKVVNFRRRYGKN